MRKYNPNINHPKKGRQIRVEPIRRRKDITSIKRLLETRPRDHLLFVMGINNGLRVGDLLKLKVSDVERLKPGQTITIREGKTGKENILMVNKAVHKAIKNFLEEMQPESDEFLFASQKGRDALTIQAVNAMIKRWAKAINLRENYGAHTLRKTFGYIQRTKFGVGFEVLAKRYNHSSPAVTMRYLGITSDEVNECLMHEI
jgi:integrase